MFWVFLINFDFSLLLTISGTMHFLPLATIAENRSNRSSGVQTFNNYWTRLSKDRDLSVASRSTTASANN